MTRALPNLIYNTLREELDDINLQLRVSTSIELVLHAVDKEFSLCANHPKRHRELFRECFETNHPGALIIHIERASGSRQDLSVDGAVTVYMNCPYWILFLDESLRTPGDNILQENIFIIISALEMTMLARFCAIIHITICLLTFWLAVNRHIISGYN